ELRLEIPLLTLSNPSEEEREAELMRLITTESRQPFDLEKGPLLRASILRADERTHVVALTIHHIVADGWSIGVFVREFAALYRAFSAGKPSPLPDLRIQYADYALWERDHLESESIKAQLSYWQHQLSGRLPVLQLPADRPRPSVQTYAGARQEFVVP